MSLLILPMLGASMLPAPADAAITLRRSVQRLVEVSDIVLEGRVAKFDVRQGTAAMGKLCPATDLVYTDITVDVSQVYKNRIGHPRFIVRVFGGQVREDGVLDDTYLPFRTGEHVLLFLQMNGSDDFPFAGHQQGIFRFRQSDKNRTMPDLDVVSGRRRCAGCVPFVVNGADILVTGIGEKGLIETLPASQLRPPVIVGPGQRLVPDEPQPIGGGGVIPAGSRLPSGLTTPTGVRGAVREALHALGLPDSPPRFGNPNALLVAQLAPRDPIVRCGTESLLPRDDPDDFVLDPTPEPDAPGDPIHEH